MACTETIHTYDYVHSRSPWTYMDSFFMQFPINREVKMESFKCLFSKFSIYYKQSKSLQNARSTSRASDAVDLNWDPRIFISNEFPGGAEATDWWITP